MKKRKTKEGYDRVDHDEGTKRRKQCVPFAEFVKRTCAIIRKHHQNALTSAVAASRPSAAELEEEGRGRERGKVKGRGRRRERKR